MITYEQLARGITVIERRNCDPDEAPEGYWAVLCDPNDDDDDVCDHCALCPSDDESCDYYLQCSAARRADRCDVFFEHRM